MSSGRSTTKSNIGSRSTSRSLPPGSLSERRPLPSPGSRPLPSFWKWEPTSKGVSAETENAIPANREPLYSKVKNNHTNNDNYKHGSRRNRLSTKRLSATDVVNLYETPDDYHDIYAPPTWRSDVRSSGTFPRGTFPARNASRKSYMLPAVYTVRDRDGYFSNIFRERSVRAPSTAYSTEKSSRHHPLYDGQPTLPPARKVYKYMYDPNSIRHVRKPAPPRSNLCIAILAAIFCNLICGIIAVKYSMSSQLEKKHGKYSKSRASAKKSLAYSFVAATSTIIILAITLIVLVATKVIFVNQ